MHPKSEHTLFVCASLRMSLNAPLLPQDEKWKDQGDDDEGDKSGAQYFQDPKNAVNIIFGRDGGFPSKLTQKLTLRHRPSKHSYTTQFSGPASHLQDEKQLLHRVHQVRGG
jgi:hypothetical protein